MASVVNHPCTSAVALAARLSEEIAATLRDAVKARGVALVGVCGGSSPKKLFEHLSAIDLPWHHVIVTQVDERWVSEQHADSNARLIREHLLRGLASTARFVPLKNAAATPFDGQPEYEVLLRSLPLPFDLLVLGMGEDGHTASLFPNFEETTRGLAPGGPLCVAVRVPPAPHPQHPRISLTLSGLLASRQLILPLSGEAKLKTLAQALGEGPSEAMPIRAVLKQRSLPVHIWTSP